MLSKEENVEIFSNCVALSHGIEVLFYLDFTTWWLINRPKSYLFCEQYKQINLDIAHGNVNKKNEARPCS